MKPCGQSRLWIGTEVVSVTGGGISAEPTDEKALLVHEQLAPDSPLSPGTAALPRPPSRVVCVEHQRHRTRQYVSSPSSAYAVVSSTSPSKGRLSAFARSYFVPAGYPSSVSPETAAFMFWRGVQYFFGGALSVFTTRSLLLALGASPAQSAAAHAAAASRWVLKDGAGRLGRLLCARLGGRLDGDLKRFRLGGDVLLQGGALLELGTPLAPGFFLPLACAANLAKNAAAVVSSATRAPVYRTFARGNNLADLAAKGESVAVVGDLCGTALGIWLARAQRASPGSLPASGALYARSTLLLFALLSAGYLCASRLEVRAVVLPFFDAQRLSLAARAFAASAEGVPPPVRVAELETVAPWGDAPSRRVVLGGSLHDVLREGAEAAGVLRQLQDAGSSLRRSLKRRHYCVVYAPRTRRAHVLFHDRAKPHQVLAGALEAHFLLAALDSSQQHASGGRGGAGGGQAMPTIPIQARHHLSQVPARLARRLGLAWRPASAHALLAQLAAQGPSQDLKRVQEEVAAEAPFLVAAFCRQAKDRGWRLEQSTLNPRDSRLVL